MTTRAAAPSREGERDRGSSSVEFLLVGVLLTALTLAVLQVGLAVYVRNVLHDAAVEGAHVGALADRTPADGVERTREIIAGTIGDEYAREVTAATTNDEAGDRLRISVTAPMPLIGLIGIPGALAVEAEAPRESFD